MKAILSILVSVKFCYTHSMKHKHIAVLDFGSQYMHLITRRIRQMGVLAKIYPTDATAADLKDAWGVIISGGPNSVGDDAVPYDPELFSLDIPVLGLCYGHQLMAYHLGGTVTPAHNREYGFATLETRGESPLLNGLGAQEQVWMSHWDSVTAVPDGFEIIGSTDGCPVVVMANEEKRQYGLQFHPEVHHTTNGMQLLKNFVFDICGAQKNWSMAEYLAELRQEITTQVGDKKVFLLVSGGVDSSVAFALLEDILGKDRVFGLHVDNGGMRLNESAEVKASLAAAGFDDLHVVDASDEFLNAVGKETEPEAKRKIIGATFLEVQRAVMASLNFDPGEWLLGQGTIYPDTIESGGTDTSDTIKTHHNRIDEIVEMQNAGLVIEPLAALYKDEVRDLGRELGLPDPLVDRWPFPGPGLHIRTLCSDGTFADGEKVAALQTQVNELSGDTTATVLPIRSVGVQGDQRSYEHPVALHTDSFDWDALGQLSVQLTNQVVGVNRVMAQVAGKTAGFELKEGYLTRDRLDILREADAIVDRHVRKNGLYDVIWQFPVIVLPMTTDGGEAIVLRPIESQEAMTVNFYHMEEKVLRAMADEILAVDGVDAVFYDITNKPPATIEWE
jgi:GMP synthase (glutamine-hydrolysing)